MNEHLKWGKEEFGHAELGDARRTARLVKIAAACARRPAGLVAAVARGPAAREAAYRFVENPAVDSSDIGRAMFTASARRCVSAKTVVVAVDQSTVSITDWNGTKSLGRTGNNKQAKGHAGLEVMSALGVLQGGQVVGLLAQQWHRRPEERTPSSRNDKRPVEQRESGLWHRCMKQAVEILQESAPGTRPWFQMDRGADINHVLLALRAMPADFTIRANWDRRLDNGKHLLGTARRSPILGVARAWIPQSHSKPGVARKRQARLAIRACQVTLSMQKRNGKRVGDFPLAVVHVRELGRGRGKGVEWFLLTNRVVRTRTQALEVVAAYRMRWSVEEFHRAWKSGVCDVERAQVRSPDALRRWATILAAVAARAERLKTAARATPDVDATTELTRVEIDAAIVLSETKRHQPGDQLTLEQAVELIAEVGGYTGRRNSGGPPGTTVISRGLQDVLVAARVLSRRQKSG